MATDVVFSCRYLEVNICNFPLLTVLWCTLSIQISVRSARNSIPFASNSKGISTPAFEPLIVTSLSPAHLSFLLIDPLTRKVYVHQMLQVKLFKVLRFPDHITIEERLKERWDNQLVSSVVSPSVEREVCVFTKLLQNLQDMVVYRSIVQQMA